MATIITSVGTVVTGAIGWMGQFLASITTAGNEILLLFVLIPLVGLGVGLLKRLMRV